MAQCLIKLPFVDPNVHVYTNDELKRLKRSDPDAFKDYFRRLGFVFVRSSIMDAYLSSRYFPVDQRDPTRNKLSKSVRELLTKKAISIFMYYHVNGRFDISVERFVFSAFHRDPRRKRSEIVGFFAFIEAVSQVAGRKSVGSLLGEDTLFIIAQFLSWSKKKKVPVV
jgi:hypothetical protein